MAGRHWPATAALGLALAIATACAAPPRPLSSISLPGIGRPQARPANTVSLPRQLTAGQPLRGQVPPGTRLSCDDQAVPVAADGRVDWPNALAPGPHWLRLTRADGRVLAQRLIVKPSSDNRTNP